MSSNISSSSLLEPKFLTKIGMQMNNLLKNDENCVHGKCGEGRVGEGGCWWCVGFVRCVKGGGCLGLWWGPSSCNCDARGVYVGIYICE